MWSLLSSPLLIGCDLTRLDPFTKALLTNDDVLDVNQDPLGRPAGRIAETETPKSGRGPSSTAPRPSAWSTLAPTGRRHRHLVRSSA